jgi:hypothetical protein
VTGRPDPGRLEAVLAMADTIETLDARRDVVLGYLHSGYADLASDAQWAWSILVTAEHVVISELRRIRHGMTFTWRDGKEL